MAKFFGLAGLIATTTSWNMAEHFETGTLTLTFLGLVMSLILFLSGLRLRKPAA